MPQGSKRRRPAAETRRGGFTLLEMVVVLAILAVVTAVATRELVHVQDQHRFEASQRGLEAIRDAILGDPALRALDGTPLATGFVADMGRYPMSLDELWTNRTGVAFALREAAADESVLVAGGWRGPYLRLPLGAASLRDGWGRDYVFARGGGVAVGHLGADGATSSAATGYDRDVAVSLSADDATASLWGRIDFDADEPTPSGIATVVRAYGPDGDAAAVVRSWETTVEGDAVWTLTGLTPGPRAVRAYRSGSETNTASTVRQLTLRSGLNGPVVLRID